MVEQRASWITPAIFNDQPLRPDREPSYFQFDNYARTFARIIAHTGTSTPLTIGINGEWGSGKTTLMRAIQSYLDQTTDRKKRPGFVGEGEKWPDEKSFRPVRTVWFNAWKYSREDALFVALVEEVMRQMRRDGTLSRLYAALSDPKAPRLQVPEAVLNTIAQVFSLGKIDLDLTRFESESRFKANLAFLDEFMEVFDQLVRWWVYRDWRGKDAGEREIREIDDRRGVLTIFIDDLDRCLPQKTVQVLESIKYEAVAYCRWLTEHLRASVGAQYAAPLPEGWEVRLPSEAEWEKAARGEFGRRWPWGDEWDPDRCNSGEKGLRHTTPVSRYSPGGDSPYGAADMAGNVWEWCATKWVDNYRGYGKDEDNDLEGSTHRVLRGGAFGNVAELLRCAFRYGRSPNYRRRLAGFRVVAAPV